LLELLIEANSYKLQNSLPAKVKLGDEMRLCKVRRTSCQHIN